MEGHRSSAHRRIIAIVAGSAGNLVEYYDFFVYSFAAVYLAPVFFPQGDTTSQLLKAAGVFALGFLARPLGGWVLGRIGDKHGRRTSMLVSVAMMCGGSLLVSLLPTYATIGVAAPLMLVVARLLQGLSVGGEFGTSAAYMTEIAKADRRGFYGSFQLVTIIAGQLLAVLTFVALEAVLTQAQLRAWGWRIPFALGGAAAVVALFVRQTMLETTDAGVRGDVLAGTIRGVLAYRRAFFTVIGFTAGGSVMFYIFTAYMQKYLINTTGLPPKTANLVVSAALFFFMLLQPIFGSFADRIGRRSSMLVFGALTAFATVPIASALSHASSALSAFALLMTALTCVSFYSSIGGLVKAELFPMRVRALAVSLTHAIATALFGGTAEYVALWAKSVGKESAFFWYVAFLGAVAFVVSLTLPDTRKRSPMLEGDPVAIRD